jgi:hypothetical protein
MPVVIKIKNPNLRYKFVTESAVFLSKKLYTTITVEQVETELERYEKGLPSSNAILRECVEALLKLMYEKQRSQKLK